jgi:hypothetical protein
VNDAWVRGAANDLRIIINLVDSYIPGSAVSNHSYPKSQHEAVSRGKTERKYSYGDSTMGKNSLYHGGQGCLGRAASWT